MTSGHGGAAGGGALQAEEVAVASEHPLFFALGKCCADSIWRTPPRRVQGPCSVPAIGSWEVSMHNQHTTIQSRGLSQQLWSVGAHPDSRLPRAQYKVKTFKGLKGSK